MSARPPDPGLRPTAAWPLRALSALPCVALLVLCGAGIHEWWLISTHQIAVIPTPTQGTSSAPEVPAARLVPLILASGALAAAFAYALWNGSRRALVAAWAVLALALVVAVARRSLLG